MIIEKSMLSPSVTLRSITTDKFKTGTLTFSVSFENDTLSAPYCLLLCELLRNCTASYPTKASFARRLDELYSASVGPRASLQGKNRIFTFTAEMIDNKYATDDVDIADEVCSLLCDMMLEPLLDKKGGSFSFPEKSFEQEKRRAISYLRATVNNPARYALQRLGDVYARDDGPHLDLEGKIKALEACDAQTLAAYYFDNIACRPIDVFYIGTLSHEQIAQRILKKLSPYTATKREPHRPLAPAYPKRAPLSLDEEMPISQGRLALAFRSDVCGTDKDFYAMVLLNEIYGGGAASKLFMNVREKLSLCYSCYSSYDFGKGIITVSSGIDPANREIAQNAILSELDDIKNGLISEKEFSAAKKAIENSYREVYDNPYGIISYYVNRIPVGISTSIDECRQKFSELTQADVVRVAEGIELDSVYFLSGNGSDDDTEEDYDE